MTPTVESRGYGVVPPAPRSRETTAPPPADTVLVDDLIWRKAAELEAVFESLADGLLVLDVDAKVVEANNAAAVMLGYRHKQELFGPIVGVLRERVRRADGSRLSQDEIGIQRAVLRGEVTRGEYAVQTPDGVQRWVEAVSSPIRDDQSHVLGVAIVAREVTERRRKQRHQELIVKVTDLLLSAVDVPSALGALADRCVESVADWCAVYQVEEHADVVRLVAMRQRDGRTDPELAALLAHRPPRLGEGFSALAIGAGRAALVTDLTDETIRRRFGLGVDAQIARRLRLRAVVSAPMKGPEGAVGILCLGWKDSRQPDEEDARLADELARRASMMLEQARGFKALEQALQSFELVLDSMGAGLMILGGDGRAILVNATVRNMLGLTGDLVGRALPDMLRRQQQRFEDARELDEVLTRIGERAVTSRGSVRLREPLPVDLEWLATPVQDERGTVLGQAVVWVDMTHLRAATLTNDDLAADLSETLRQPLQAVSTQAAQALRRARRITDDSSLTHSLEVILRSARQISTHVNDLVDAAHFDPSILSLELREADVQDVVQRALDQARAMTTVHRFRLDMPPAIPPPRWDADRVRQALLHVLSNAVKFWPEGGQIGVRVRPQLEGVVISVRDRGMGIPPADHDRVFERFVRLAADPERRKIRGNGLGLYLVRGVAEAHGGMVWVESSGAPGEGTTLHLLLPWLPGRAP